MADHLKHKEYLGSVEVSLEDDVLHGEIIGISDLVTYQANTIGELQKAFVKSVDDYLETCKAIGKQPNKFFKGVFNVRTSSQRHRDLAIIAEKKKMKLNELINRAFDFLVNNEDKVLN